MGGGSRGVCSQMVSRELCDDVVVLSCPCKLCEGCCGKGNGKGLGGGGYAICWGRRQKVLGLYGEGPCIELGVTQRGTGKEWQSEPDGNERSRSPVNVPAGHSSHNIYTVAAGTYGQVPTPRTSTWPPTAALPRVGHWRAAPVRGGVTLSAFVPSRRRFPTGGRSLSYSNATRSNSSCVRGTGACCQRSNQRPLTR